MLEIYAHTSYISQLLSKTRILKYEKSFDYNSNQNHIIYIGIINNSFTIAQLNAQQKNILNMLCCYAYKN